MLIVDWSGVMVLNIGTNDFNKLLVRYILRILFCFGIRNYKFAYIVIQESKQIKKMITIEILKKK